VIGQEGRPLHVIFALSGVFHGVSGIKDAYDDAVGLFRYHTLRQESQILSHQSFPVKGKAIRTQEVLDKARCLVKVSRYDKLRGMLAEILEDYLERGMPVLCAKETLEVILIGMMEAVDHRLELDRFNALYKEIDACVCKGDFVRVLDEMIVLVAGTDESREGLPKAGQSVVERVCRYLEENYSCFDISLTFLADRYRMSPNYLSKLFREQKKMNYSDFLCGVRMEKAKSMLAEADIRIKDLCNKVGYRNPNVFIKAFRKRFGVSPGEYKRLVPSS
jgi:YesN/AraC family two-component response regulator